MASSATPHPDTVLQTDTGAPRPIDAIVPGGLTTLFAVFAITTCLGLYWLIGQHHQTQREDFLLRTATETANSLTSFQTFYSERVVAPLIGSDITVTHEFQDAENAIPLPATLVLEFSDFLKETNKETAFRLVSEYPFPARTGRTLDRFERDAIAYLKDSPDKTFHRFESLSGAPVLRFAKGVAMKESCVACHNSHPQSPFRNWAVGDLRGIQEVILPASADAAIAAGVRDSFRNIIIFAVAAFSLALLGLFLLARRNRLAFEQVERLASLEQGRVTELQQSKQRIEEGFARLSAVVENVAEAIITISDDGIIETANPATERVFGYKVAELLGENVSILMTSNDARGHDTYIRRYLETGEARVIGIGRDVRGRHKNGSEIPLELSISEVNLEDRRLFTGIVRDVSERKQAEQALRESEEQARKLSLVAARTDNAVVITDRMGCVEWVNEGFTRISGYEPKDIIGKTPGALLQRDDVDKDATTRIKRAMLNGRGFHEELLNYSNSGTPYWISMDAQPIFDESGEVQQYIAIEQDITERRQREEDLEEARLRAEEASKAKSKFLAMMSHEVRTPLNGVIGALGLLRETDLNEQQHRYAETSRTSAESLLAIINDILDYSKMEAGKLDLEFTSFDVRDLIQSVKDTFSVRFAEKSLELRTEVDPTIPAFVVGDPARTRQILVNLVGNALKFTERGRVELDARALSKGTNCVTVEFAVKDTGIGIAPDQQTHLFEEFSTGASPVSGVSEGTGLGLAISKRLISIMGGEIGLQSAPEIGSRFWFQIPYRIEDETTATNTRKFKESNSIGAPESLNGRVLLVEDNPANQMISQAMLEKLGLRVDVVANGIEAVDAVKERPYDLVLMDIAMPEMDGLEATNRIRALSDDKSTLPIVAMTAHAMHGDREKFLGEGLDDYLVKPVTRQQLIDCLSKWLYKTHEPSETKTSSTPAPETLFDAGVFERLIEDVGEEILPELIDTFLGELNTRAEKLEQAASERDLPTLAAQAHPLKSSSANFGAMGLSQLASEIESTARAGEARAVKIVEASIADMIKATRAALLAVMEARD